MSNQVSFHISVYGDCHSKDIKLMKRLCRKMTGERLQGISSDMIIYGKYNNHIVCMCFIHMESPDKHFANEEGPHQIPYLYNFICDDAYKSMRVSVALMEKIKSYCELYPALNLNVKLDNTHAAAFFERNGFVRVGEFNPPKKNANGLLSRYYCYTFEYPALEMPEMFKTTSCQDSIE